MENQPQVLAQVLVVDDDSRLRELLRRFLEEQKFVVVTAENVKQARAILEIFQFDIIILDIMMPGENGLEFLRSMRSSLKIPVLFLSAKLDVDDRILGLEVGADDYLAKPFEPKELVLRIKSIIRRSKDFEDAEPNIHFGACQFNRRSKVLWRGGEMIPLTGVEAKLLESFVHNEGVPLTREQLCELVGQSLHPRSVDVQVTRLRKKIEINPKQPTHLLTVRHAGYVFWRQHR